MKEHRVIDPAEDCFLVTSNEGEIFFKSPSDEPTVCGIYMITDPDKKIQVTFNYLDVPCENGGLVAWIDGWELNGQIWPADAWNDDRLVESCDSRPQNKLTSSQNAALIQYRVPAKGKGFAITVHHLRNNKPCNIMVFDPEGVYTLRNHGEAGNCSVLAIAPAIVQILALDVGQSVKTGPLNLETGTIHFCKKRGLPDYVDIGGATGLDHTKMKVLDNICGLDSMAGQRPLFIACEETVVRLVSSGLYKNSVTIGFSPLIVEHIQDAYFNCAPLDK
ncbi:PREDICTED: corticotropin-releasing factor-binding protein [Papilio polytes]|uniref:corticotropin-releasing factor-binding protein n=1 Tax=Papilio polytes TaxID=76194 RepID=UPI000675E3E5|nr:PREDICTED: corticotropin-releasing factor-binding protein [Papilio polytes]